jgi:hypothetical protein
MKQFLGQNVVAIHAPQDRNSLEFHVLTENNQISVVRFANDDGTPVEIEFSHVDIHLISDGQVTLGEFEELNEIEGGYEIVGDFGIYWVKCKKYECLPKRS